MQQTTLIKTSPSLPEHYLRFRSQDMAQAQATISQAYDSHQLEIHGSAGSVQPSEISLHQASLDSVSLSVVRYGADVTVKVDELTGIYVLMPLHGSLEVNSGGQTFYCTPGEGIVLNAGVDLVKTLRDNYSQIVLKFDSDEVMRQLANLQGSIPSGKIHFEPHLLSRNSGGGSWWRTVQYVMEEIGNADTHCPQTLITKPLEQLLIQNLLRSQPHNFVESLLTSQQSSLLPWHLKKALNVLHAQVREEISSSELARQVGVSERNLQYSFKKNLGVSPMQYLKAQRLELAHNSLQQGGLGDSVTAIALACGYRQPGLFSSHYKQRYGVSPSQTLRRSQSQSHS